MSDPRVVTPKEAWGWEFGQWQPKESLDDFTDNLAHTVATEPERIAAAERAAVVKALRDLGYRLVEQEGDTLGSATAWLTADAIESGGDL